ncbi:MAG TPA: SGNH/GDSL hydrolase family protein [Anaerolineales bacterium]
MPDRDPNTTRNKLIGPLIAIASTFLCIGILELTGFIWESRTAQGQNGWTLVGARRLQLERHGGETNPYYKFKPDETYNWEDIPVYINSKGFRGAEFTSEKPGGVYRILNLGDSVAFGWEVNEDETYGEILEYALNQHSYEVIYEVINLGVPTLNLEAERNLFIQEAKSYHPDLVILEITVVNDIYGSGPNISEERSIFSWLRDRTYFWPFLTNNIRFLLAKQFGPEAFPVLNPPQEASAYFSLDEDDEVYRRVWGYALDISDAAREMGADTIIVVFPTAFQINSSQHPDIPQKAFKHEAELAGLDLIDLLPVYGSVCEEAGRDECEGYENLLFADVWMHPNPLGHKLAADELFKLIVENNQSTK